MKYQVYFSDGCRQMKEHGNLFKMIAFCKSLKDKGIGFALFKDGISATGARFHSTTQTEFLIGWWNDDYFKAVCPEKEFRFAVPFIHCTDKDGNIGTFAKVDEKQISPTFPDYVKLIAWTKENNVIL